LFAVSLVGLVVAFVVVAVWVLVEVVSRSSG
jgi:hypothetical protein